MIEFIKMMSTRVNQLLRKVWKHFCFYKSMVYKITNLQTFRENSCLTSKFYIKTSEYLTSRIQHHSFLSFRLLLIYLFFKIKRYYSLLDIQRYSDSILWNNSRVFVCLSVRSSLSFFKNDHQFFLILYMMIIDCDI